MRLALLGLPWSTHTRPSAALGVLAAYIRQEEPSFEVCPISDFVSVASKIGFDLYDNIAQNAYTIGELLYMAQLYPAQESQVRAYFVQRAPEFFVGRSPQFFREDLHSWEDVFAYLFEALRQSRAQLLSQISTRFDVFAFTTCFGQLFANLLCCKELKEQNPRAIVVLGGSTVSDRVGPSLLEEYPYLDYIIQGEGEQPLLALLRSIEAKKVPLSKGLLARENGAPPQKSAALWEVPDLCVLPVPDYGEYAERADQEGIEWSLPIEGSRGCWWDRTKRTQDPKSTCYFCNINAQWGGYREKSVERVVSELKELTERYANTHVFFLDNIIRAKGVSSLAKGISALGKDLEIFYEMRANIKAYDLLLMWEAGLTSVQFGIEALSSSLLQRIGKGTKTIQNLEAMKLCFELGIENNANLLLGFPGSTQEEVEETYRAILQYAIAYQPCQASEFHLEVGAAVDALREEFPITNIRGYDVARIGLPERVWQRLSLFELSYDHKGSSADWSKVREARQYWSERHTKEKEPLLVYYDGGTFLRISDRRQEHRTILLEGALREVYLFCMEIKSLSQIKAQLKGSTSKEDLAEILEGLVENDLLFEEGQRYLSLAAAHSPKAAAKRIRAAHQQELSTQRQAENFPV